MALPTCSVSTPWPTSRPCCDVPRTRGGRGVFLPTPPPTRKLWSSIVFLWSSLLVVPAAGAPSSGDGMWTCSGSTAVCVAPDTGATAEDGAIDLARHPQPPSLW